MKAIVMTTPGNESVLHYQDVPDVAIQDPSEVLINLKAAGINPIDTKIRQRGTFYPEQMPAVLGCDGAGVIEAVGEQVQQFQPGDEVYFCHGGLGKLGTGNYAQYAVVHEGFLAPKPQSLSFAEAAAAPLVLITAWEALYDRGRLEAGRKVLIHAGAGGVGHMAIQLAKLQGAEVYTTVSTPEKAEFVKSLGADYPIFYKEMDFVQAVCDWTGGEGVDLAFDTVGGSTFEATFPAVQRYGDLVTLLKPGSDTNWNEARSRNLRIGFELMLTPQLQNHIEAQKAQADILRQGSRLFDQGKLKLELAQTFPLPEATKAHSLLATGSMQGKIALVM